ncbi:MAG TPA: thiamine pyrophosphate-dependent enzyme [Terracidiphilus sp.]|jgi:pyruvate dehydrogenase E1 component alpha subunit|nr:thiamine pyrophosphate-dependent enzyme [Terracidiphilus sp.]
MSEEKKSNAGEAKQEFSLISNDTLLELYGGLLKRCALREVAKGKRAAQNNGWTFDAAAVAVAKDLVADDTVIADGADSVLRAVGVGVAKNGRGNDAAGEAFSLELERAVGAALAHKTKKSGKVSVVFGGNEHGQVWMDALEIARAHRLPMVFVSKQIEHVRDQRGPRKYDGVRFEPGTELAQIVVDGNDVVAAYRVAHEAIDRARRDRGPTLIECAAFRMGGRRQQDPVANMENYLRGKGMLKRGLKREILVRVTRDSRRQKR